MDKGRSLYSDWSSAPTANTCDPTVPAHLQCLLDPFTTGATPPTGKLTAAVLTPLCDDNCQLLCTGTNPIVRDPECPVLVDTTAYTGKCVQRRMANGQVKSVCT